VLEKFKELKSNQKEVKWKLEIGNCGRTGRRFWGGHIAEEDSCQNQKAKSKSK
jgi:hypothetical protein